MVVQFSCFHCHQPVSVTAPHVGLQFGCPHCGCCNQVISLPPAPAPPIVPPQPKTSTGEVVLWSVLGIAGAAAGGFLLYKGVQYATDTWQGSGDTLEFRASFKRCTVTAHVRRHGYKCTNCGRWVRRRRDLHVDHRKTIRDGGGAWASNAQVRCRRCNLRKGGRSSTWEYATGR